MSTTENSELKKRAEDLSLEGTQNNNCNKNANGGAPGNKAAAQTTAPATAPTLPGTAASKFNPENQKDLMTLILERLDKVEEELAKVMCLVLTPERTQKIRVLVNRHGMLVKMMCNMKKEKEYEPSSNDSAGKQPRAIPLDAYPSFNPFDWESEVVTDVARASVNNSTIPCTSFANFVIRFEDVLVRYDRNVQTDWYECLYQVFSISKHAGWFDRWIAAGVGGKRYTWEKAKHTIKVCFGASAKSPLSWAEALKELRQDENERLMSFADRFLIALMGANIVLSEQNKRICFLFFVNLMPKYREQVSKYLKQAYKNGDRMDVDYDEAEGIYYLSTSFSEIMDFCVTASGHIEAAVKEFVVEESKKRASSGGPGDHAKPSKKRRRGNRKGIKGNSSHSSSQSKKPGKHFRRKL